MQIAGQKPKEGYPKFINGVCCIQYELESKAQEQSAEAEGL